VKKFLGVALSTAKVVGTNTLIVKPIFEALRKKILRTPISGRVCVSKTRSFSP